MGDVKLSGFTEVRMPIWVLAAQNVSDGAKVVFGYLAWRQGTHAGSWPSIGRIARDLGISYDTVTRRLAELEQTGLLQIKREHGRQNVYDVRAAADVPPVLGAQLAEELRITTRKIAASLENAGSGPPADLREGTRNSAGGGPAKLPEGTGQKCGTNNIEIEQEEGNELTPIEKQRRAQWLADSQLRREWKAYLHELCEMKPVAEERLQQLRVAGREDGHFTVKHDPLMIDWMQGRVPDIYARLCERVKFVS